MASAGWMGLARATNNLPELTTRLYGIKTNADLERSRQGLTARELDIRQQGVDQSGQQTKAIYGQGGIADRQASVAEGNLDIERQKLDRSTALAQKPYSPGEIGMLKAGLINLDKENGTSLQKSATQFLNNIQERSALGHTKADIYVDMKANYGTYIKPVLEGLQADLERAAGQGDMQKVQQIAKIMDGMSKPEFLDAIMPNAARFVSNQQRMIDAEIAEKERRPEAKLYETVEGYQTADNAIGKIKPERGMEITTSDGTTIRTGVNTSLPGNMQKTTAGKIEEKLLSTGEGLSRISNIVRSFKPEYQEIPTKLGVAWSSLKSKLGANIPREEKAKLEEFGKYKQDALENINLYIKEITGAQMSEKEADRIRKAQPDPGEGIFGGDDPVSFKSKLVNQYQKLRMAQTRYNYYLSGGLNNETFKKLLNTGDIVSLEQMEKIIDDRGAEYEAQIRKENPNINATDLFTQVKNRLAKEFKTEF